eukprot:s2043_g11.t1
MALNPAGESQAEIDACAEAKAAGNAAYANGELESAWEHYMNALDHWDAALCAVPKTHETGTRVRYSKHGFGMVMSAFPMFDEYFLKDLGTDQAIWAGEPGGDLKRFPANELRPVGDELFDLRFTIAQNLAAVCLKRSLYKEAIEWADAALSMDGKAPKALMRLGAALLRSGKPGPASDRLAEAQKAMPNDPEVRKLLREAELKRSPTWVCANGCCGPWGLVCGGPIAETMPGAVQPRLKENGNLADAMEEDEKMKETHIPDQSDACSSCADSSSEEVPGPQDAAAHCELGAPTNLQDVAPKNNGAEEVRYQTPGKERNSPVQCRQLGAAFAALAAAAFVAWRHHTE